MAGKKPSNSGGAAKTYAVESIVDKRVVNGKVQYLVQWKNYPSSSNTWEPKSSLTNCLGMVKDFEKTNPDSRVQDGNPPGTSSVKASVKNELSKRNRVRKASEMDVAEAEPSKAAPVTPKLKKTKVDTSAGAKDQNRRKLRSSEVTDDKEMVLPTVSTRTESKKKSVVTKTGIHKEVEPNGPDEPVSMSSKNSVVKAIDGHYPKIMLSKIKPGGRVVQDAKNSSSDEEKPPALGFSAQSRKSNLKADLNSSAKGTKGPARSLRSSSRAPRQRSDSSREQSDVAHYDGGRKGIAILSMDVSPERAFLVRDLSDRSEKHMSLEEVNKRWPQQVIKFYEKRFVFGASKRILEELVRRSPSP